MPRVCVLGFDGLDMYMTQFIPKLKTMSTSYLDSIIPLTYPSWASVMSGVNPGKHGLLGFYKFWKENGMWKTKLYSALDLDYPRVHETIELSPLKNKIKFAVVNPIPDTPLLITPISPANFVARIDFFSPPASNNDRMMRMIYDLERYEKLENERREHADVAVEVSIEREIIDIHCSALEEILKRQFNLVWYNVHLPDRFIHFHNEVLLGKIQYLKTILEELNSLVSLALKNCEHVIVVSDHGFKAYFSVVRVNTLLYREGLAVKASDKSRTLTIETKYNPILAWLSELGYKLKSGPLSGVMKTLFKAARKVLGITGKHLNPVLPATIDSINSKAFMPTPRGETTPMYYVLLNDVNVARRVVELLKSYGLGAVHGKELTGPHARDYIVFTYPETKALTVGTAYDKQIEVERIVVDHYRYGVFAYTKNIDVVEDNTIDAISSYCVAPIVLQLLGVPLDPYMDCKIDDMEKSGHISYMARFKLGKRIMNISFSGG